MVNIIHVDIHCDDERKITAVEIKLKSCPEEEVNENSQHLVARASAAFYSLSLFSEFGKTLKTQLNPKRKNIMNITVTLRENELSFEDVARFIDAFQEALDDSPF